MRKTSAANQTIDRERLEDVGRGCGIAPRDPTSEVTGSFRSVHRMGGFSEDPGSWVIFVIQCGPRIGGFPARLASTRKIAV